MTRIVPDGARRPTALRAAVFLLVCSLFLGAHAVGAIEISSTPGNGSYEPALRIADGKILLSLDEAIEIALRRNLSLVIDRYTRRQFQLGIDQAIGNTFDTLLQVSGGWSESTSPAATALAGANVTQSESQSLNTSVAQIDPIGGRTTLSFNNSRSETNSTFALLNPSYTASLGLSYQLPLLRNFGTLPTRRGVLIARLQDSSNRAFFEQQVSSTIQQVENAYWDLVEARDQLGVAEEALSLAEELHRRNRVQVDVGTLAPLELVQSEANIAIRQEEIIQARTNLGNAEDNLRLLLNLAQGETWETEIVPETDPQIERIEPEVADAIAIALTERPELAQQRLAVEQLDIDARFFANQVRPRLDLSASYNVAGLGGDVLVTDPASGDTVTIPGGWDDAIQQVRDRDFDNWSLGLFLSLPLQNRAARAQKVSAGLELDKGKTQLTQLEQQIITEVRAAVRRVRAAAQQIESATVSERLQEKNLDAEEKRYENGMSTSFQVTQIQEDLTRAKSRKVNAVASYRRALADYYRTVGRLLEETGVILEGPGTPTPKE